MFLFSISLFEVANISAEELPIFSQMIRHVSLFGNDLYQQKIDSVIKNTIQIVKSFDLHILEKPTFDISNKYKLTLQKYKLSCEIAALRMVIFSLTWESISEEEILSSFPIFEWKLWEDRVWWDPEKEFVWSYTGSQRANTGYGVYEAPLAEYLDGLAIKGIISNIYTDEFIMPYDRLRKWLDAIHSGSRVILWWDWCTSLDNEDGVVEKIDTYIFRFFPITAKNSCDREVEYRGISWYIKKWALIKWLSWEHVFLLLWYIGSIEKPTHIIVWDTDTGKHVYRYSEWMRKWKLLEYRMLIIHPKSIGGI